MLVQSIFDVCMSAYLYVKCCYSSPPLFQMFIYVYFQV